MLALSPLGRAWAGITNYDRYCDLVTLLILALRGSEILVKGERMRRDDLTLLVPLLVYFAIATYVSYTSEQYEPVLFLLEGKLVVTLACLRLFANRAIHQNVAKPLIAIIVSCYAVGTMLFVGMGDGERLALLNESNYMIVVLFLLLLSYTSVHRVQAFRADWAALVSLALIACVVARSRTGFATIGLYVLVEFIRNRRSLGVIGVGLLAGVTALAFGSDIFEFTTRGAWSGAQVDRLIFLREYLAYIEAQPFRTALFAFHAGTPITENVQFMQWWVLKQSLEKELPYALAPYNLHSGILRTLSAYGAVFTCALLVYAWRMLYRTGKWTFTGLLLASMSMSALYLSSVLPFIVLVLLVSPRFREGSEKPNWFAADERLLPAFVAGRRVVSHQAPERRQRGNATRLVGRCWRTRARSRSWPVEVVDSGPHHDWRHLVK